MRILEASIRKAADTVTALRGCTRAPRCGAEGRTERAAAGKRRL